MNRIFHYICYIFFLLFIEACTSTELFEENVLSTEGEVTRIEAVSLPFNLGKENSRTSITMGNNSIALPVWCDGDTIGIFPSAGGDQLSFPIVEGVGTNTCVFTGGGWALKASTASTNYTYTAYTPFNRNYYLQKDNTALPISMLGQEQIGNDNSDHLGAYDLQIANGSTPINGKISFAFQHKVAIVRMDITAPCAASWKSITLNSTAAFTTKATMNLSLDTPSIVSKEQSNSITLNLKNVSTTANNLQIVAYMMLLPVDFTNKTLYMELLDTEGNIYVNPVSIDNPTNVANPLKFGASNARWISAKFDKGASPSIPYVTFMADNIQTFSMSKEVWSVQYSVNGGDWKTLGSDIVTFGGEYGILQLRASLSPFGTWNNYDDCLTIQFGNDTPVACSGDIRTLLDYDDYATVSTEYAKFGNLFSGCKVLTSAPRLPATTLAENCYMGMFRGCTNLMIAPELPATTLAEYCYDSMFNGCTNLITAPELPATNLATMCYEHMFGWCTNLLNAPELPATTLAEYCYYGMFYGCEKLKQAPELPAKTLKSNCYSNMFGGCVNLVNAPELPATTLESNCYEYMFQNCEKLEHAPKLPANILFGQCYEGMFCGCTSLKSAPELPATAVVHACYRDMFNGCKSLAIAPGLPAITLDDFCYQGMFNGCSSLTSSPKLPATTLTRGCYYKMFAYCTNLNNVIMLANNIEAENCIYNWLLGVASTGTFTKAKELTSLPTGDSGIPYYWEIKNYQQ